MNKRTPASIQRYRERCAKTAREIVDCYRRALHPKENNTMDDDNTKDYLAAIPRAYLDTLAKVCREVAKHDREHHNCPNTAEILEAVAKRLEYFHAGVLAQGGALPAEARTD